MGMITDLITAGGSKGLNLWGPNKKRASDGTGSADAPDTPTDDSPDSKKRSGGALTDAIDSVKRVTAKRSNGKGADR